MKPIYLIRHGQGENNINEAIGGWSDPSLTELGIRQAEAVANRLAEELKGQEMVLYSSNLKRANETAQIIGRRLNITPITDENLQEYRRRLPPELSRSDAKQYFIEFTTPAKNYRMYPNSESLGELYYRAVNTVSRILDDEDKLVLLVSHYWFLDKVIAWWVGMGVDDIKQRIFKLDNASISELTVDRQNERILVRLNDTSHLKDVGS